MAIAGCASKRNRFLFIFQIGLHAWRRRDCTICITSQLITKRIGRAKQKLPRGKLRAAARVITRRGSLTLADSVPGLLLHRGDFFARSCADVAQRQIYIRVASMNRGLMISRSECCAINSGAPGASIRQYRRRWAVPSLVHPVRARLAAASVSHSHPFLADRALEILDYVKLRPRK